MITAEAVVCGAEYEINHGKEKKKKDVKKEFLPMAFK